MITKTKYELLSEERKELQAEGSLPNWFTTGGWQMFKEKYLYGVNKPIDQYRRIAKTAAKHAPKAVSPYDENWLHAISDTEFEAYWEEKFFELFWKGYLSPSTPVLANTGTNRGLSVSCSGGYVADSIHGFYDSLHENAMLTKKGFGTSAYLDDVRCRGSDISDGGKASGVVPVFDDQRRMTQKVTQGQARRGAVAGYLGMEHGDFYELVQYVRENPDDSNPGWLVRDEFIDRLDNHDKDAIDRYQEAMAMKATFGKGYFVFPDKINRLRPLAYQIHTLFVKASNLCTEITLFSDEEHTFTCVLSSLNAVHFDVIKYTDAGFVATVFLDCIASDFIEKARGVPGLEKAVRFTEKGRALGLGVAGFHTYLQQHMMPFDSADAMSFNIELFSHIRSQAEEATTFLAKHLGEPEWCKGLGRRNTHLLAVAPTKSTALIMGGISEGINPDPAMTFTQTTAVGEVDRANPTLLQIMKDRGVYDDFHMEELVESQGSVQKVDWLSDFEKEVFKTAFEINQKAIIQMASARQIFIDQGQSLNLFFSADEDEAYISEIHEMAFKDPYILALYYMYSKAGVTASKSECLSCM